MSEAVLALNGYGLMKSDNIRLSNLLMEEWPVDSDQLQKCYAIRGIRVGQYSLLAQAVEGSVFHEAFADKPEDRLQAWSRYEALSCAIVALERDIDGDWQSVGTMRIITSNTPADLKSVVNMLDNWREEDIVQKLEALEELFQVDWNYAWDIATMATDSSVLSKRNGHMVIMAMLHALYVLMQRQGIKWLFGILAERPYNDMQRLGMDLVPLGPCKEYYGVPSIPFVLRVGQLSATLPESIRKVLLEGHRVQDVFDINLAHLGA